MEDFLKNDCVLFVYVFVLQGMVSGHLCLFMLEMSLPACGILSINLQLK